MPEELRKTLSPHLSGFSARLGTGEVETRAGRQALASRDGQEGPVGKQFRGKG